MNIQGRFHHQHSPLGWSIHLRICLWRIKTKREQILRDSRFNRLEAVQSSYACENSLSLLKQDKFNHNHFDWRCSEHGYLCQHIHHQFCSQTMDSWPCYEFLKNEPWVWENSRKHKSKLIWNHYNWRNQQRFNAPFCGASELRIIYLQHFFILSGHNLPAVCLGRSFWRFDYLRRDYWKW